MGIYKLPAISKGLLRATGSSVDDLPSTVRIESVSPTTLDYLRNGVRSESALDVAYNSGEVESTTRGDYLFVTETVTTPYETYQIEVLKTDVGAGSSGLQVVDISDSDIQAMAEAAEATRQAYIDASIAAFQSNITVYEPPPPETEFYYEPAPFYEEAFYFEPYAETAAPIYQPQEVAVPVEQQEPTYYEPVYYVEDDGYGNAVVYASYDGGATYQYEYTVSAAEGG